MMMEMILSLRHQVQTSQAIYLMNIGQVWVNHIFPDNKCRDPSLRFTWHCTLTLHHACQTALLHKPEASRDNPNPRRSYATAGTGTVAGRPSCVKRLSKATRTCSSVTWRSNVRAITRSPKRLKQCILVSTRLLR